MFLGNFGNRLKMATCLCFLGMGTLRYAESKYEWLPQRLPNIFFKWVMCPKACIFRVPRALWSQKRMKSYLVSLRSWQSLTITIIHEAGIWTNQDFMGCKYPTFELHQPGSEEFQQGSQCRGSGWWGDWPTDFDEVPSSKDGGSSPPSYGVWCMCQIPLHHSTGAFGEFFTRHEFLWMFLWYLMFELYLCDGRMMSNPGNASRHPSLPHSLLPPAGESGPLSYPIKTATHNVSQLPNEHGTVCSLLQVGTRLLSIFQLDTWTSYMTPSNVHANGLKMLKESDEGRIL